MPTDPQREPPSTYFVQNRESLEEMVRQEIQDKMLTKGQGGVLPELADPGSLRRVLDVGCGTGGWLIELARTYPSIEQLVGIDISGRMLAHARAQAEAAALGERVQLQQMDALRLLEFPPASFDLVNQRLGVGWLRTWEWKKVLLEYRKVSRPSGIVRITEGHVTSESNSEAFAKLCKISLEVCFHSGRLFTETGGGIANELVRLLTQHGFEDVQSCSYTLVYRPGTEIWQYFYEDMVHAFRVALPFFHKWTHVPSNYEEIYQQTLKEMQQPGFEATYTFLTAWGRNPNGRSM